MRDAERTSDPAVAEAPDAQPATRLDEPSLLAHLALDSKRATIAYWSGIVFVTLAVFVPRLLPCVDYPQHLALADVARRLADPGAAEQATHQLNYFTYNGLFHVLAAMLARAMPIELAGRTLVALSIVLLGGSVLALLRVLRRPPAYAALFTPVLFSFALGWGFVNYALGTAIAVAAAVFVARSLRRPTPVTLGAAAALGLLCAMTHVLAMLLLCLFAASLAPEVAWRSVARHGAAARRATRATLRMVVALAPLLVGAGWCIAVYREQYAWDPAMYQDATLEGTSPPIWEKIVFFGSWATGVHSDYTDQGLVWLAALVVVGAIAVGTARVVRGSSWDAPDPRSAERAPIAGSDDGDRALALPVVAMGAAFLLTPMVFIGTHLIFPRLAQGVVLGALLAAPRLEGVLAARARLVALSIGAIAGANLTAHAVLFAIETNDASRVIDELPPGRRATAVVHAANTYSFRHGALVHLAAYYAARKAGDWSFSFARYLSVPVRFRPGGGPAWPQIGWEFTPRDYNPRCKYARHFDLVIVKAPLWIATDASGERDVRNEVFGRDADAVRLLSHHGAYWAFDTAGLPDDGTL